MTEEAASITVACEFTTPLNVELLKQLTETLAVLNAGLNSGFARHNELSYLAAEKKIVEAIELLCTFQLETVPPR